MAPAFVQTPFTLTSRTSFAGASVSRHAPVATCTTLTMTASSSKNETSISRRKALFAAVSLMAGIPLTALAKSGDSPKISIFGVGGQSSPFTAGYETGGKTLYSSFNKDELAVYKRIVDESKDRIVGANDSIKSKSWEDVRSRCRLEAFELRKVQSRINDSIKDKKLAANAKKAAEAVKVDIEQLDQAAVQKNQDLAYKKYNLLVKDIDNWVTTVGL